MVAEKVVLPAGDSISWSGQFEFLERATARLNEEVPFTLLILFEVMQRIAVPMVGGMITAPLLSMFVIPAYLLMRRRKERLRLSMALAEFAVRAWPA